MGSDIKNGPIFELPHFLIFKSSNLQIFKFSNPQIFKFSNSQINTSQLSNL